jgi:hypothetical protein
MLSYLDGCPGMPLDRDALPVTNSVGAAYGVCGITGCSVASRDVGRECTVTLPALR